MTIDEILAVPVLGAYQSPNYPEPLMVTGRSWASEGAWRSGHLPVATRLSADAVDFVPQWHPPSWDAAGDVVYVEWVRDGRLSHGWIDAKSRRLVQVG